MTTLSEAKIEISTLQDEQIDLQRRLEHSIECGDDPDAIMILQKAINENAVRQYAAKSKIIRLTKNTFQVDRETAITDREALEQDLKRAALLYEQKLRDAEDARVAYQTISLRLGILDNRIETDRQAINERQQELGRHISQWKEKAYAQLTADSVCDY